MILLINHITKINLIKKNNAMPKEKNSIIKNK